MEFISGLFKKKEFISDFFKHKILAQSAKDCICSIGFSRGYLIPHNPDNFLVGFFILKK
jgi:hypothetical protein